MTDRFDEMAGRVQMDLAAFAMPTGTSARRVIADALRAAHAGGVDEAAATIDQLRADIEKLRDDRADLQERCNRLMAERNAAVHMVASADSEWKVRAEKAERERDEWKARHDTLADVSRKCIATAERERDEARAERDALHVALELAEVEVALDRSWCRICRTECRGAHRGRREHMHAAECVLNIRAHAAKVKP